MITLFMLFSLFIFQETHCINKNFTEQNFFIKKGYTARKAYVHFDDTKNTDKDQNEVYKFANDLAEAFQLNSIVDIGCGSGFKLIKYFHNQETTGYEIEPTLSFLKKKYPERNWERSDFSSTPKNTYADIIICSDVIEHLVNPDDLLNYINRFDFKYLVISTPDRKKLLKKQKKKQSQVGPPVNPAHIREWELHEFSKYLSQYFEIIDHINLKQEYWGQLILAKKIEDYE